MTDGQLITKTDVYRRASLNNVTVSAVDEYIQMLVQLGYCPKVTQNAGNVISENIPDLIVASERLFITGDHTRNSALSEVLPTHAHNNPENRLIQEMNDTSSIGYVDGFVQNHERAIFAAFVAVLGFATLIGLSTLLFPTTGFIAVDNLHATIARLEVILPR